MKSWHGIGFALLTIGTFAAAWADQDPVAAPAPQALVPGVWMIPGGIRPDRQPDGNTVVFDAPSGLVVVDTGRHRWHRDAILSLARAQGKTIASVVNTHWHLDHVSGNPDLRTAYPGLRVYSSNAIDDALSGFLAASARDSAAYLDDPQIPASMREDIRADMRTIENGTALKPDVVVVATGALTLGGRALRVHLARDAVTAGDVWLYDEASRVAVLGDLVTLPAPFLDTACPAGWQAALGEVSLTPFELAIPGHGAPMTRAQFLEYRSAFDAFIDCSYSVRPGEECAARWSESISPLLSDDPLERKRAEGYAAYYVDLLRSNDGRSKYCPSSSVATP